MKQMPDSHEPDTQYPSPPQAVPDGSSDHSVVLLVGMQTLQALPGSTAIAATVTPLITQSDVDPVVPVEPLELVELAPVDPAEPLEVPEAELELAD